MAESHSPLDDQPSTEDRPPAPALSVCVSLKNRSRVEHEGRDLALFPRCVRSLADCAWDLRDIGPIELVVADFGSDDWPVSEWLTATAGTLRALVLPVDGPFSRGRGLNEAAAHASSERLLLFDADILIGPSAMRRAIHVLEQGRAWLPVCRYLDEKGDLEFWQEHGFGVAALSRSALEAAGGVPEFYSWGGEDDLLYARLALHVAIDRERTECLDHQWHPRDLRFLHTPRPFKSDFRKHYADAAEDGRGGPTARRFLVEHPRWRGELHLLEGGRARRPGVDAGDYVLEERRRIVIRWDRWPATTLDWVEEAGVYRDRASMLTLSEIPPIGPDRPSGG